MTAISHQDRTVPGLTVVIPTTGERPALLRRAIESCLALALPDRVEILVVRNAEGPPDTSSRDVADDRVRYLHIGTRNANMARNAGLQAASGEYLRFLDDDDVLDPDGALAQYVQMCSTNADISTGIVSFEDADGREFNRYAPASEGDFVAEILRQRHSTLPVAHLFRRRFLGNLQWNPQRRYLQDVDWMHSLVLRGEVGWHPFPRVVGSWCHHAGPRISSDTPRRSPHHALKEAAKIVEHSSDELEMAGRLNPERCRAAAKALWDYAHQGFPYDPRYWHRIACKARRLDPASRPLDVDSRHIMPQWISPIVAEWLLFPLRAVMRRFRD